MRIIPMKQIREVLRLYLLADLSSRKIQGATGVARTTVQDYIKRCKQSDITSSSLDGLDDDTLRVKFFGEQTSITVKSGKIMPDYNIIHEELKQSKEDKSKVTLSPFPSITKKMGALVQHKSLWQYLVPVDIPLCMSPLHKNRKISYSPTS